MTTEKVKRKLTAILSADVKGYSRLMGADEVGTIRILQTYRGVISDLIQKKGGRVVDSPGDNVLAEFASVVDAMESAVEIQRELKVRNADRSESRRMEFRIGINLGDVVEEGERIYGDGVNIAARIEGLAEGGGICISGTAFDHIGKRLPLGYEFMGEQEVKNIEKPVRAYRVLMEPEQAGKVIGEKGPKRTQWRWAVAAAIVLVAGTLALWNFYFRSPPIEPASKEKMAFPLPDKPSIAVLPFVNMTGDPGQEFFSDGLSEDIITALSKIPRLFVIARHSSFSFKGKPVKVQQVSEELGVQYVLEGSIQKSGDRVRVTAQLIDALKGHHLWAERFERSFKDLFAIQDSITKDIITALNVKLTEGEQAHVFSKGTENLEAYLKIMEARWLRLQGSREGVIRAKKLAEEAIALDPKFALAYSSLGNSHMMEVWLGLSKSPKESLERDIELQKKALALDNKSALAHSGLGNAYAMVRQWDQSIAEGERAYAIEPNTADVLMGYGTILCWSSRFDQAIPLFKEAMRLDPKPPSYYWRWLAIALREKGKYDEAISLAKKAIEQEPNDMITNVVLTTTYVYAGREEEARAAAKEILRINPNFNIQGYPTGTFKDPALIAHIQKALRIAGLPENPPLPLPDKPSIAVLPFVNMSDDKSQEYFSDGMTEDLITDLSKISGLFVIARNSTFVYKGKPVNVQQVSRELGVKYVLEGSVRRAGDQVRINAQLIDSTTGQHLWAERYDGSMQDVFSLQDRINKKIVAALAVKLTTGEKILLTQKGTDDPAAYEEFMKGREHYLKFTMEDLAKAEACFKRAIELDPSFGRAQAALALLYFEVSNNRMETALKLNYIVVRLRARLHLIEALKKPTSISYQVAGLMDLNLRQWDLAISQLEKALALDPNDPTGHDAMSWVLSMSGKPAEGIEHAKSALRLDPLNPARYLGHIGIAQFCMGDWKEAATATENALKLNPELRPPAAVLAAAYAHLGRNEEAKAASTAYYRKVATNLGQMHFWPFKDRRAEDSFVEGLIKAGFSGGTLVSVHVSKEDQITGDDLRALTFPSKIIGSVPDGWSQEITRDGIATLRSPFVTGGVDTGRGWLEGDKLWFQYQKYLYGMAYCNCVFKNPRGTPDTKDEYIRFHDLGHSKFSRAR